MANNLITRYQRLNLARQFRDSFSANDNHYYFFIGAHNTNEDPDVLFDNTETTRNAFRNMIMGKLISNNSVKTLIRNIPYVVNTVYDMYDDQDEDLESKDYYVITDAGSFYHVFKCLDNNQGANSTSQPDFTHINGANTILYQTADGYRWKYMYSVSESVANNFQNDDFFPVISNTEIEEAAVAGAIDIIKIEEEGRGYDNYLIGTFASTDVRINGNNILYLLSSANASSVNGFYTGCLMYISAGAGIGEYRTITDYFCNANGNFAVLDSALTTPSNGSEYQLFPEVVVVNEGGAAVNTVARAMVNASSSNCIYRVEILDRGQSIQFATAEVMANAIVGVAEVAELRPIHSPKNGHGYDSEAELRAWVVGINQRLSNSESNTILTTGSFQQIGIIQKPLFANVQVELANSTGSFLTGEAIHAIRPIRIGVASVNTTSPNVVFSNGELLSSLSNTTLLYLKSSNGTSEEIILVSEVTNSIHLVLASNASFACTTTFIYLANSVAEGVYVNEPTSDNILVANVVGHFETDDYLIGNTTGVTAYANTILRNDVAKGFNTYIQMYKYVTSGVSGTFTPNETVYQGNSLGVLHSAVVDGGTVTLYLSNQVGQFTVSGVLTGNTSGAIATLDEKYSPELVARSGDIVYIENISPVARGPNQSEHFKIYLEF
jgi:hypothetical protein